MIWHHVPGDLPGGPYPRSSEMHVVESLVAQRMEELLGALYRGPLLDPVRMETWRYQTMVPADVDGDLNAYAAALVLELLGAMNGRNVRGSVLRLQGTDGHPCVATAFLEFVPGE